MKRTKLYRVEVTGLVYVTADDEREAKLEAVESVSQDPSGCDVAADSIEEVSMCNAIAIEPQWLSAIPFGITFDDRHPDATVAQIAGLEPFDVFCKECEHYVGSSILGKCNKKRLRGTRGAGAMDAYEVKYPDSKACDKFEDKKDEEV